MKYALIQLFSLLSFALGAQTVTSITIDGTINPAVAQFVHRCVQKSAESKASCLIIHLNTPGGLVESTRNIVGDLFESPIPVIVYVSPSGAHAGSAGVFITLAGHLAAMAPGTNIGAAHPVGLQGEEADSTMAKKVTNDAAAFIRTIAEKRKRNPTWAEEAVRQSVAITASEALNENIIDLVASNDRELLEQVDGKSISLSQSTVTLHTRNATVEVLDMGFAEKMLNLISDPNIAYVLMMIGFYGLIFELFNPGAIFPGIVGFISLVLAFYSLHSLPVNYAGLALIVFGIVLFLLELKLPSHGLLSIGGVVSLLIGSLMLFQSDKDTGVFNISRAIIVSCVTLTACFFLFVVGMGLRAQQRKPVTGLQGLLGEVGEVIDVLDPTGSVRVRGEYWKAQSLSGKLEKGMKIRIREIKDLTLYVEGWNANQTPT